MDVMQLLLLAILIYALGGLAALLLNGQEKAARVTGGLSGVLGSLFAAGAAGAALLGGGPTTVQIQSAVPFGRLVLEMDGLSAFLVAVIGVVGIAASAYSIAYLEEYRGRSLGVMGFLTNFFMASMILVVTVGNAFYFLIFWEMMTLASYFLVIFEQEKKESVQAGYLYFLVAHAGTALIMLSFFVFYLNTGSFDFDSFRAARLSPAAQNLIFLLSFAGFGAKAGIVPLHIWLPRAHPAAPSHISALLSGVMIKTAVYGILRTSIDFLGAPAWWWGFVVLSFGGISALLGILYALAEKDLKRLLAYSSVENIGIILMGVGTGMIGVALRQPVLSVLGILAALYHLANHAFYKGLLFLGAGSIVFRLHTKDLNRMGGLAQRMPATALAFLTGALAVAAIPPLNGFASEWLTFQAFFTASSSPLLAIRIFAPLFAALLAITGALTAMCFMKAYGSAFSGPARSQAASTARETPAGMVAGLAFLAIGSLLLGIGAPLVAPLTGQVAAGLVSTQPLAVASGVQIFPADPNQAVLSTPLVAILLLALLALPFVVAVAMGGYRAGRRQDVDPWSCGYGYKPVMAVSAGNFDHPVRTTFRPLYTLRTMMERPLNAAAHAGSAAATALPKIEPVIERVVTNPLAKSVDYLSRHIQALQMGDLRVYCFYIVLTLAILLVVAVR